MKLRKKNNTLSNTYRWLVFLRILLVLVPQTGYIHPDEWFQFVEVLAGKFLDVQCSPPWEFNTTSPIRSMAIPYYTVGMSYKILKDLNSLGEIYQRMSFLNPYHLLVIPRLLMCLFSFLVDYCLYKICLNNNEKYKTRLVVLASSYIMIVYGTRTFSNTLELVLFSVLLYFVCESMTFWNVVLRNREYINFRCDRSKTTAEKVKLYKLLKLLASDSYRNCFAISTVSVMGFFNRPTFVAFAVMPVFFWLYHGLGSKSVTLFQFFSRIFVLVLCSIPTFLMFILVDSFFYGHLTWGEIGVLEVGINNFVFTPLNFLRYNLNTENLASHGIHPRFLHVLVNVPLLFNVLGLCMMYALAKYYYLCYLKKFNLLPTLRSIKCLMTAAFIVPVALLSAFPHQEPRFLIPVLVPLVYLQAMTILPEPGEALVEAPKTQSKSDLGQTKPSRSLLKIWLLANLLLAIVYGFLHQGGVFQASARLQKDMQLTRRTTEYHIVTSHIYSLPESLFMQKASNLLFRRGTSSHYSLKRRAFVYEEGSNGVESVLRKLGILLETRKKLAKEFKVFLLMPGSLEDELSYFASKTGLRLDLIDRLRPHVSFEALPDLTTFCLESAKGFYSGRCSVLPFWQYARWLFDLFSLNLYQVDFDKTEIDQ